MGGYLTKSTMLMNMLSSTKKDGYYSLKIQGVTAAAGGSRRRGV
jgi:hypothetical protein